MTFDSAKEARRYSQLLMLQKAGRIEYLRTQVKFDLIPTMKHGEKTLRKIVYIADFVYRDGCVTVVEDSKGFKTDVFKLKLRLFLQKYPSYEFRIT